MLDVAFVADLIRLTLSGGPFPDVEKSVSLLLGTCAQESGFQHRTQMGSGPAKGIFQCEPSTEADIWANYLVYQPTLRSFIEGRSGRTEAHVPALEYNVIYQILLARTHYMRCDPQAMPAADDIEEQSRRWKKYYNTPLGHGTEAQYVQSYQTLVAPYYRPVVRNV